MAGGVRIPLNRWQQAAVALGSAVGALLDPRRADLIAALGETTGKPAFERVLVRMKRSAEGRAVLSKRPRVISSEVGHAWDLPSNTFGAAYAKFMGSRNFSPDDRPPVRFMDTDELEYVAMRAREVHDFWHTLFGLPTNLIGESALKVIEFEQMQLPNACCLFWEAPQGSMISRGNCSSSTTSLGPFVLACSAQISCAYIMSDTSTRIWMMCGLSGESFLHLHLPKLMLLELDKQGKMKVLDQPGPT